MPESALADSTVLCEAGHCTTVNTSGQSETCTNGNCTTVVAPTQQTKTICTQQGGLNSCTTVPCTNGNCTSVGIPPTIPPQNFQPTQSASPTSVPLPTLPVYNHYYRYTPSLTPTSISSPTAKPTPVKKQSKHAIARKENVNLFGAFSNFFSGLFGIFRKL